jgi:hypothetical protein
VSVTEVWDTVELTLASDATIEDLKRAALAEATGGTRDPASYVVKYRGGLVVDETQTLARLGVPDGAPFIVLPARRQPVR